ncbi:hypothetical protein [Nannocystis punicea]|uniref:Uncharacterized protein n=1 Tax=Nannocystis punicea TaxID=2995304 RepID=A0ABY7HA09_9BACT|nr:hypothetical protein [Nannocystis poenicansa]WAS96118.1 hypothetical protein O0S08_08130 [Nannocystis poenicansa]
MRFASAEAIAALQEALARGTFGDVLELLVARLRANPSADV